MPGMTLTRVEAAARSEAIKNVSYDVYVDITRGEEFFFSQSTIKFDATKPSTFLDLIAKKVTSIELNGEAVDVESAVEEGRINLTGLSDHNVVTVKAFCPYSHTGEGLHRSVDPTDSKVYLYSQFEVMDCRRVYACFDQPDIKATFNFVVDSPTSWTVLSTTKAANRVTLDRNTEKGTSSEGVESIDRWTFETTPVMSTYLTSLIAGPYASWKVTRLIDGKHLDLGLYCRQSIKESLGKDASYIFDETEKGFHFYSQCWGVPYPYSKYDQIFVPEYNAGAMENIANVTIRDSYVFQSKVSQALEDRRITSILHELAHMWFGDLVTMKWWNDLWLNESFAEFMSTLCAAEATEWKDEWATFACGEKNWGQEQDQLPTTHPIVADINDISDTEVNFDGITYAKGAAVLKQLVAYVGRENFFRAINAYLLAHAYSNATLKDLLSELNASSGRDLDSWAKLWLETSGINTLTTKMETNGDGIITSFKIQQKPSAGNGVLRPHRIEVGFYDLDRNTVKRECMFDAEVKPEAETEIFEIEGQKRPDFILINDEDLTYAKLRFDPKSLAFLEEHIADFEDPLARAITCLALWDMTRDGEYPAEKFVEVIFSQLETETQSTVFRTMLKNLLIAVQEYVPSDKRAKMLEEADKRFWKMASSAEPGSDRQFQLVDAYLSLGTDPAFESNARGLLSGSVTLPGFEVDNNMRWSIVIALAHVGAVDQNEINEQLSMDESIQNKEFAYKARAIQPTKEAKAWAWDQAINNLSLTNSQLGCVVTGFAGNEDPALYEPYVDLYFENINSIWSKRTFHMAETLLGSCVSYYSLYPYNAPSAQVVAAGEKWLTDNPDAPKALKGIVEDNLAKSKRRMAVEKYNNSLK